MTLTQWKVATRYTIIGCCSVIAEIVLAPVPFWAAIWLFTPVLLLTYAVLMQAADLCELARALWF